MQHDQALADMFFNDAMARAAMGNPDDMVREMQQFEQRVSAEPFSTTVFDHQRFLDQLKGRISRYIASGE